MPTLLRIDASSRRQGSYSRDLADAFEAAWRDAHPGQPVVHRDLVAHPVDHIRQETITGFYTPPEALDAPLKAALALSDELIDELTGANTVLISAPMYNFSVPSALKAWIDHVCRLNRTFAYDGANFTGLLRVERLVVVTAFGAAGYGGPLAAADFITPYLKFLFGFLGIRNIEVVAVEATTADGNTVAANMARARDVVRGLLQAA